MDLSEAFLQRVQRMDELVRTLEDSAEPVAVTARELAKTIVELHGAGLARVLAVLRTSGEPGRLLLDRLVSDDLVRSLLMLHDLHPIDLESRVRLALENLLPLARGCGCELALLSAEPAAVRLRLVGADAGPAATTLRNAVEQAILEAAPDVLKVEFEDPAAAARLASLPIISLTTVPA